MAKKKEKKVMEPQYYMSATNMRTYNYKVYYMKPLEKLLYFVIAFIAGAAVGYLFYGGIGKDEFGQPTTTTYALNVFFCLVVGLAAGFLYVPMRRKSIIEARKKKIKTQFRDLLDALSTSIGAGENVPSAFKSAYSDLKVQYDEGAYILKELEVILSGLENNIEIVALLQDFAKRSGSEDIESFANVFQICYQKGGNIRETIRATHNVLSDKMEIVEEIETTVTSGKMERNIMMVMPIGLIGIIKLMSPDLTANFVTPAGIAATTIAIVLFGASYIISRVMLDIKV